MLLFRKINPHCMNIRFIVVGVILGAAVTIAFLIGSPMFGGFDALR